MMQRVPRRADSCRLLTIYDLAVEARWTGKVGDEEVTGTLRVPEVSHEAIDGLSDYEVSIGTSPARRVSHQYHFSTSDTSASAATLLALAKKAFPDVLTAKFNSLRPALLEAHGAPSSEGATPGGSGASTPAYSPAPPGKVAETKKPEPEAKKETKISGTKTVEVEAELQASADDLWGLLTEESKIPMWSRSAAQVSPIVWSVPLELTQQIKLEPGAPYSLFGGNVTGKVQEVKKAESLVQSWQPKMPGWPSDHYGTMRLAFNQGESSTKGERAIPSESGTQADQQ